MNNYTSNNPFTRQTPSFISTSNNINTMNYYSNGYALNTLATNNNTTGSSKFDDKYFNSSSTSRANSNENVF